MSEGIKIVRKKGFILNPDDEELSDIINSVIINGGHCPTYIRNREGHDQCPCSDYLQNSICHCKLYVHKNQIRNEED